ncbi:hypothetical protein P7C71_g2663, partial [Lecanoromycetidae sp. Uapishka_2]
MGGIATALQDAVNNGSGGDVWNNGVQMACAFYGIGFGTICAFYQHGASGNTSEALALVEELQQHNCANCGSAPTGAGNPDVDTGCLTVNYVSSACCDPLSWETVEPYCYC